jgi:hypothetical protein
MDSQAPLLVSTGLTVYAHAISVAEIAASIKPPVARPLCVKRAAIK